MHWFSIPGYHKWFESELISKFPKTLLDKMGLTTQELLTTIQRVQQDRISNDIDDTKDISLPGGTHTFISTFLQENVWYNIQDVKTKEHVFQELVNRSIIIKNIAFETWEYDVSDDDVLNIYLEDWFQKAVEYVYTEVRKDKMYKDNKAYMTCPAHRHTIEMYLRRDINTYIEK